MHGMSLGPADLAASRGMKTTRVGGGHPAYGVLADAGADKAAPRAFVQQDLWHYTVGKMVDACLAYGLKPFYGPFGDFADSCGLRSPVPQRLPAGLLRRLVAAPLADRHRQARLLARRQRGAVRQEILDAMPDGTGAVMIDGKMQDDATWKQAKVIVDLAKIVASKDAERAKAYGL